MSIGWILLQYFHHTRVLKKTLQKQGKQNQASCGIYTDIHFNHRNSYLKAIVHTDSTLGNQQAITNLLLVTDRDLHPYFMGVTALHCYITSPANYCLYVLEACYIQ